MIQIKPFRSLPPGTQDFPAGAYPPYCFPVCSRKCVATQAVCIWRLWSFRNSERYSTTLNRTITVGIVVGRAANYYMDQYGCRAIGPPPRSEEATVLQHVQLVGDPLSGAVQEAWTRLLNAPEMAGIPPPGTITALPTVEQIFGQLMRAIAAGA